MKRYESKYACCPFYHNEDSTKIYCEGVEKDSFTHNVFTSPKKKTKYRDEHCCQMEKYQQCPLYKEKKKKYNETTETTT